MSNVRWHLFFFYFRRRRQLAFIGKGEFMEEYQAVYQDGQLYIKMPKELDHEQCEWIRKTADDYMYYHNIDLLIFDFADTQLMDSSGVGVILGRVRKLKYSGGNVTAIHLNDRILHIFIRCGLDKVVQIQ
jgi:stage II sporulation protein AA (anti-sigma F factor antagonist)